MQNIISFEELGIQKDIVDNLLELEISEPTEIQQKAIPVLVEGKRDFIGMAQTGTGKTAAFGLPAIQSIRINHYHPQVLIIAPTRELCMQIANDLRKYSRSIKGLHVVPVYGGSSIGLQIKALKQGAHIVVATPGRLVDLIERKAIQLDMIRQVVLDEADEMLNMGFREDMEFILAATPAEKSTALFSATMSKEIREIASNYLNDPFEVTVGRKNLGHPNITHQYAVVHAKDKLIALKRIIDFHPDFYGIVFCNTKIETQELNDALLKDGFKVDCIHGDLEQAQREKVMHKFRNKYVSILFATDVAARGIDVKNLTHIIHYHLPDDIENYTHRSGRTARAGQKGFSIALLHIKEAYKLHRIEKMANLKFGRYLIPTASEVAEKRISGFIEHVVASVESEATGKSAKNEWIWPLMQLSKDQLVDYILKAELNKYSNTFLAGPDVNVEEKVKEVKYMHDDSRSNKSKGRSRDSGSGKEVRMYVSLGKLDQLRYDELREVIFKLTHVSGRMIRDIDLFNSYSFFLTDTQSADKLCSLKGLKWKKRDITFKRAEGKRPSRK
ncbi:MAG: DEAD/DEAH box helicase [Saprospiraceae bacterium]|nr:DEAD/DEAH box helicase [Saprospiraceae bacterium]